MPRVHPSSTRDTEMSLRAFHLLFIALSVMPASRQALTAFDAANFMRERRFMASIPDRVAMIAIFALRDDALRLPRG